MSPPVENSGCEAAGPLRNIPKIPAKTLGALALPGACDRCFWIKQKVGRRLPFQIFPGIFSSIDGYTKQIVHSWFDEHGSAPPWLAELGEITGCKNPHALSEFSIMDGESGIHLRGIPDEILVCADGSHLIVDYKTAKRTGFQDGLFPMYEVQLNVYALIGEETGLRPVSGLALVYTEPQTSGEDARLSENRRESGFAMAFSAKIQRVDRKPGIIPPLLARARKILDSKECPARTPGCKDCAGMDRMAELLHL